MFATFPVGDGYESEVPTLYEMADKAIEILSKNENGFVFWANCEEEKRLLAKGVYAGRADSNFIEIMINNKYISAKLSPALKAGFDNLDIEEEDNVTIEYTLEKGVYVVHKISKNWYREEEILWQKELRI